MVQKRACGTLITTVRKVSKGMWFLNVFEEYTKTEDEKNNGRINILRHDVQEEGSAIASCWRAVGGGWDGGRASI